MNDSEEVEYGLETNEAIARLTLDAQHGSVDPEPRTIRSTFPGEKTRAMGHALVTEEMLNEEPGIEAEREYVKPCQNREAHVIDIHINGGNPDRILPHK